MIPEREKKIGMNIRRLSLNMSDDAANQRIMKILKRNL